MTIWVALVLALMMCIMHCNAHNNNYNDESLYDLFEDAYEEGEEEEEEEVKVNLVLCLKIDNPSILGFKFNSYSVLQCVIFLPPLLFVFITDTILKYT